MYRYFANSPALFQAYSAAEGAFRSRISFSASEQEIVLLTASVTNNCHYCKEAYRFLADNSSDVPKEVTTAILSGTRIPDKKMRALSKLAQTIVENKGWIDRESIDAFVEAGYTEKQVLDVIAGVGVKLFSN